MTPLLLGNLFELKYGKSLRKDTRSEGIVPVFGSNGQVDVHSESLVNHPTIIVGRKGSIGEVHLIKVPCWPIDTTYFVSPRGEHQVDLDWLYRLLRTLRLQELNRSAAIPGLNREDVYRIPILLPPLDDQIRIAHLLGKVEGLIAQRKQHLQQLNNLLKSVFLEMFGDPVRNEKGWKIESCEKAVLEISSGTSYGGEDRPFANPEEIGVLKISAVTTGTFDSAEFKVVNRAHITKALRYVKRGDFLFSRANTIQLVAACCIVPEDYDRLFLPDKLWVLTLNEHLVKPQFLNYLLKNERYRDVVRALASGGHDSMLNISMKKFMTLGIPCPPEGLQNQFGAIVEKVDALKSRYQQSLTELEALYGALSQKAFNGELNLSRVAVPAASVEGESPAAAAVPAPTTTPVIELSETDLLLPALQNRTQLPPLLRFWLEAYCSRLGSAAFSLERFIAAAQTRLSELHPDNDFELRASDYEHIKAWIFEALDSGRLKQERNQFYCVIETKETILGNWIELKASQT